MKLLLALIVLTTTVLSAAEKPSWGTDLDAETNTLTLSVYNNDEAQVNCKYSVNYFVNVTTYKRFTGKMILAARSGDFVSFANERTDHLSRIRAKVSCE